jgi:hypothetical protein
MDPDFTIPDLTPEEAAEASLLCRWRPLTLRQKQAVNHFINTIWRYDFSRDPHIYTQDDGTPVVISMTKERSLVILREVQ